MEYPILVTIISVVAVIVTTIAVNVTIEHVRNHSIKKRVHKLSAIRDCEKELSVSAIIEYMRPPELREDSGIKSQGSYCRMYCVMWCIPEDFQYGWLCAKHKTMSELRTNASLQDEIIKDYFYGEWFNDYCSRVNV